MSRQDEASRSRSRAGAAFDGSCSDHIGALYSIWSEVHPDSEMQLPSERWKDLGFQGADPRTDLRGCGITGLVHLERALLSHRAALDEALCGSVTSPEASPLSAFPLAIASINCSAMLLSYLHVAPKLAVSFAPGAARVGASQATLHGFLSLGVVPEEVEDADDDAEARARVVRLERSLEVMHARLLLRLASSWRLMVDSEHATLMDFPRALHGTHAFMVRAVGSLHGAPWHLDAVDRALGGDFLDDDGALAAFYSFCMSVALVLCCATNREAHVHKGLKRQ